ncbi:hypothetical protein ALPO108162_08005 [Alicyclobacillus pomorum]
MTGDLKNSDESRFNTICSVSATQETLHLDVLKHFRGILHP